MRNSNSDLEYFERKGKIYEIYNSRVLNFFNQVVNNYISFNPSEDFEEIGLRLGYSREELYLFFDKNADLFLESNGTFQGVYRIRE